MGQRVNRRQFLHRSAVIAAGNVAFPRTALSYVHTVGANDRISLGHIGVGVRGIELDGIAAQFKDSKHIEMTAVCDLWTHNREKGVAVNEKYYGRAPRAVQHPEELLGLKDVDAVLISTPDHSHSALLKSVAEAGKDAYCEKPMGNVLEE